MVVLDTSIIIDHLRQKNGETYLMELAEKSPKENLAISVITVQELYEGKSSADQKKEEYLLATISPLKILPYNYEVAKLAGKIARDLEDPIELADAAIAATTITKGSSLFTLNKKDFKDIPDLDLFKLE